MAALRFALLVRLPPNTYVSGVAPNGRCRLFNGGFLLAQPIFNCRVWQRGAQWHWQCMNDIEVVLASGIAESQLAARNAAVSHCLQCVGSPSGPN